MSDTSIPWTIMSWTKEDPADALDTRNKGKSQSHRSRIITLKETNVAVLRTPMQVAGCCYSRKGNKEREKYIQSNPAGAYKNKLHGGVFFIQERLFFELCSQNYTVACEKPQLLLKWLLQKTGCLPSGRKGSWDASKKRWLKFQNSNLMLYHIWDFQIHSWMKNHFRLQPFDLLPSWFQALLNFIYVQVTEDFSAFRLPSASILLSRSSYDIWVLDSVSSSNGLAFGVDSTFMLHPLVDANIWILI